MSPEDLATFNEAMGAMSLVEEVHTSLSKGDWDFKYIEFLNQFKSPLDMTIKAYQEVQRNTGSEKPEMAQVMEYMLGPDFLKKHKLSLPDKNPKDFTINSDNPNKTENNALPVERKATSTFQEKLDNAKEKAEQENATRKDAISDNPKYLNGQEIE